LAVFRRAFQPTASAGEAMSGSVHFPLTQWLVLYIYRA